jgi:hypothetical protein
MIPSLVSQSFAPQKEKKIYKTTKAQKSLFSLLVLFPPGS